MAYSGRRGPNVSEYIANLNAIPSAQDLQSSQQDNFNFEDDLAMFTNTNFFDFDLGVQDVDLLGGVDGQSQQQAPASETPDMKALDFGLQDVTTFLISSGKGDAVFDYKTCFAQNLFTNFHGKGHYADNTMNRLGNFDFPDFNAYAQPTSFTDTSNGIAPPAINTNHPIYPASSAGSPNSGLTTPAPGTKRKAESMSQSSPTPDFEEASRLAAEEDKRRRNTAASARFRVKKKQREQALEKSSKEMNDKVAALEGRINQLETENKWLKNLITEKNDSTEDITLLWKKFNQETSSDRKGSERKDGVGTEA